MFIASLCFYSYWNIRMLPVLIVSILFNYLVGSLLGKNRSKPLFIFGIAADLAFLGYFKYFNFFLANVNQLTHQSISSLNIILPVGISFFTFTQIAYLVDIYKNGGERYGFLDYGAFVSIFPHLVAGPIIHHSDIISQLENKENQKISYRNIATGLAFFSLGLFKKVIIADYFSPVVNFTFSHVNTLVIVDAWVGALAYTLQLYFDFSGYSDMAVGLGLMFNIKLPFNFDSPYKAKSFIEFWKRWHISLSNFFMRYMYIPLGGNRRGFVYQMRNLLLTMFLCGMWHGAGWTFIVWGAAHGLLLVVNHLLRKYDIKIHPLIFQVITFTCVVILWVVFRSNSLHDSIKYISAMFGGNGIVIPVPGSAESVLIYLKSYGVKFDPASNYYVWKNVLMIPTNDTRFWRLLEVLAGLLFAVFFLPNSREIIEKKFKPSFIYALIIAAFFLISFFSITKFSEFLYFQF